jgi:hypothetical protein
VVSVKLTATLTADGEPLQGKILEFYKSLDGVSFELIGTSVTDESGSASISLDVDQDTYFKAVFKGDEDYEGSESDVVKFTLTAPFFVITEIPERVITYTNVSVTFNVKIANRGSEDGEFELLAIDHYGAVADRFSAMLKAGEEKYFTVISDTPYQMNEPKEVLWRVEVYNKRTNQLDDSKYVKVKFKLRASIEYEVQPITTYRIKIKARLVSEVGKPLSNKMLEFYKSLDGVNFSVFATCTTDQDGYCEVEDEVTAKTYYKIWFAGDDDYMGASTWIFMYEPAPVSAPARLGLGLIVTLAVVVLLMLYAIRRRRA